MPVDSLVSPFASASTPRPPAPRWSGEAGLVMLSDSMLNSRAGWGTGILAAVADVIGEFSPRATVQAISRPQIGDHQPHEFVRHLVESAVAALVVTAGDCATCTSRALRECVLAEAAGIPATCVIPYALEDIVQATIEAWGRPDLQVAWLDKPLFQWRPESVVENARPASLEAWHILTGR